MRVAIIGRTEMLFAAAQAATAKGHQIACVITAKPAPESTKTSDDFQGLANRVSAPYRLGYRFDDELVELLRTSRPDIALAMNWPTMMNSEVTNACGLGVVNAHGSDLPKFRGNACPNWAILRGEDRIGLTFHYVDPFGLDTGPIILKKFLSNGPACYIGDVYTWLRTAIPEGFSEVLDRVQEPSFEAEPQPKDGAIRAYPRKPEDGLICWSETMENIHRLVRASSEPFPGAFTHLEDRTKVTIWRAEPRPQFSEFLAVPGQLMYWEADIPVIACRDGGVALLRTSLSENRRVPRSVRTRFYS